MKLFISYARINRTEVESLVKILSLGGYEPWFDYRLMPGQEWKTEILKAIQAADVFVYAMTNPSLASDWCRWEFAQAIRHEKPVIPIMLHKKINPYPPLNEIQAADFSDGATPDAVARLIGGITKAIRIDPAKADLVETQPKGDPPQSTGTFPQITTLNLTKLAAMQGHTQVVNSVTYLPDGKQIVSASLDRTLKFWNAETFELTHSIDAHNHYIWQVVHSPDGKLLATASEDKSLKIWDVQTKALVQTLQYNDEVLSATFSPDGSLIAMGMGDGDVIIWDLRQDKQYTQFHAHDKGISGIDWSPIDRERLATGSGDSQVKLWDVSSQYLLKALVGHEKPVNEISFSPDGQLLASASYDGTIRLWDLKTYENQQIMAQHQSWVLDTTFSPDGLLMASVSADKSIRLWAIPTGEERGLVLRGHGWLVRTARFSPDSKRLVTGGGDNLVKVWEIK